MDRAGDVPRPGIVAWLGAVVLSQAADVPKYRAAGPMRALRVLERAVEFFVELRLKLSRGVASRGGRRRSAFGGPLFEATVEDVHVLMAVVRECPGRHAHLGAGRVVDDDG